jgi:hypothetical protein
MPRLAASAKRICMYIRMCMRMLSIRMLTSMCIRIGIGGARMPRLAAFAQYVCMYIRMLTSMCIRIGIGGARMPRLAASTGTWGVPDERRGVL